MIKSRPFTSKSFFPLCVENLSNFSIFKIISEITVVFLIIKWIIPLHGPPAITLKSCSRRVSLCMCEFNTPNLSDTLITLFSGSSVSFSGRAWKQSVHGLPSAGNTCVVKSTGGAEFKTGKRNKINVDDRQTRRNSLSHWRNLLVVATEGKFSNQSSEITHCLTFRVWLVRIFGKVLWTRLRQKGVHMDDKSS